MHKYKNVAHAGISFIYYIYTYILMSSYLNNYNYFSFLLFMHLFIIVEVSSIPTRGNKIFAYLNLYFHSFALLSSSATQHSNNATWIRKKQRFLALCFLCLLRCGRDTARSRFNFDYILIMGLPYKKNRTQRILFLIAFYSVLVRR